MDFIRLKHVTIFDGEISDKLNSVCLKYSIILWWLIFRDQKICRCHIRHMFDVIWLK